MHTGAQEFTNEELLVYFGCLNRERNVTEIARSLFPNNYESVRASISRKDAVEGLMEDDYITPKKSGSWKYKSDPDRLGEVVLQLLEKDHFPPRMEVPQSEERNLQELFIDENVRRFFDSKNLQQILGPKVSDTKQKLSFYLKQLTLVLGSYRELYAEMDDLEEAAYTINPQQVENLMDLALSMIPDDIFDFEAFFDILRRVEVNIGNLPSISGIPDVYQMAEATKQFIRFLASEGDISGSKAFFQPYNPSTNAACI